MLVELAGMKNGGRHKFLLLCAALFFYIYPVTLVGSGLPLWIISYFLLFVLWLLAPFNIVSAAFIGGRIVVLLILSIYAALVTTITYVEDYAFSIQIFKVATIYTITGILVGLICVRSYGNLCFDFFLRAFVGCAVVQALFVALSIISIEFRYFLDAIINSTGNTNYLESFRVRGFSSAGGASLSLIQAIGVAACLYLYRTSGRFIYIVFSFVVWVPTIAVGRTGFFLGALMIFVQFFLPNRKVRKYKRRWILPLGVVAIIMTLMGYLADQEALERLYDYGLPWAFEFFVNSGDGNFSTATTSELVGMLVTPDQVRHLVFGVGAFDSDALGYTRSDSGYIKTLYASGIIGCLIFYSVVVSKFYELIRLVKIKELRIFITLVLIVGMIVEIKEPFLYQNYFGKFIFLLFGIGAAAVLMKKDGGRTFD